MCQKFLSGVVLLKTGKIDLRIREDGSRLGQHVVDSDICLSFVMSIHQVGYEIDKRKARLTYQRSGGSERDV